MKIFGKVVDEFDGPIMDAHVYLENFQSIGDVTSLEGNFIIDKLVIEPNDVIIISCVGFKTQKHLAKDLQGKKIILLEDVQQLNEIVLTPENTIQEKPIKSESKESFLKKYKTPISIFGAIFLVASIGFTIKKNN